MTYPKDDAPVFILTMKAPQGLCVARRLGRRGIPVFGLDDGPECLGFNSRYCRRVLLPSLHDAPEAWIEYLVTEGQKQSRYGILFPCNDESALLISAHRETLEPYFSIRAPHVSVITLLLDKTATYQKAQRLGLAVPHHLILKGENDLERVKQGIGFPCAIKPCHSHEWKKHFPSTKLFVVDSERELHERLSELGRYNLDLFVTELIPGDDTQFYALYTYIGADGRPLFTYTKRKLRQYPPHFGNGSLHEGIWEPEVARQGLSFLKELGFQGFSHVEFKKDPRDNRFKLIEVNPRCAISLALVVASGIDAPYLAYREMLGGRVEEQHARTYRKKLLFFEQDCDAFRAYHRQGLLSWRQWLGSLWGTNVFGIFAWDDPMPFVRSMARRAVHAIKNYLYERRVRKTRPSNGNMKYRVLYLDAGSGSGGSAVSLLRLLRVLNRSRWDPVVIVHQSGKSTDEMLEMGIPVHSVRLRPEATGRGFLRNLFEFYLPLFYRLIREFRAIKPDLIHLNNSPRSPFVAVFAARLLGIPIVSHLRANRPLTNPELFLVQFLKALVVISHSSKRICEGQGVLSEKLHYVPNGLDVKGTSPSSLHREETRKRLGILNGAPTMGVVSRLMPLKGQHEFIQAMAEVVKVYPDARAIIAGDECEAPSNYLAHLKGLVSEQGLSGNIQFTGWVEHPETLYPAFDLLAQTSLMPEGFSLVCLEAMAHAIPVVSTRVGAIPELVEDGVTGLLVTPGDPNAFANALLSLLRGEKERRKMGEAAQKKAQDHFDIQRTKEKIEALYEKVLQKKMA
ncbi:MAG: glycosyltransferase [Candidatus Omnitrophica bacterium]|nr:glycosyltransferase [Candidatus Omnitrophota bacterium]